MIRTALTTTILAAAALLAVPAMAAATTVKTYVYGGGRVLVSKHANFEPVYWCDSGYGRNDELGAVCEQDGFLFSNRVNFSARPNAGYRFVGFTAPGNTCAGVTDDLCTATAWGAGTMTVHARFVDDTRPDTYIHSRPLPRTSSRSADFRLNSSQDGAHYECKLDAEEFHACDADVPMRNLTEGLHTLAARAIDPAGNVDDTPATYTWEVDTTGPLVTVSTPPAHARAAVSLAMQVEPNGRFQCTVAAPGGSAGLPFTCTAPFVLAPAADGRWTVQVRGVDDLDNVGPWVSRNWVHDTASPTTYVVSGPAEGATVASRMVQLRFGADDANPVEFTCSLDGGEEAACASPYVASALGDGEHAVQIRAQDGAGNTGTLVRRFVVDATAPVATITGGPAEGSTTTSRSATFVVGAGDAGATLRCELDGVVAEAPCAGSVTYAQLGLGEHVLRIHARDAAGNVSVPSGGAVRRWTVVAPVPVDPVPVDPVPVEPKPMDPTPGDPAPVAPAPVAPEPVAPAPQPGGPVANPARDTTAPKLGVRVPALLRLTARSRAIALPVTCSEACTVRVTGRGTIGKVTTSLALPAAQVGAGAPRTLQVVLPPKLRAALRTRATGVVMLTVSATDAAGNRAQRVVRIKVVR